MTGSRRFLRYTTHMWEQKQVKLVDCRKTLRDGGEDLLQTKPAMMALVTMATMAITMPKSGCNERLELKLVVVWRPICNLPTITPPESPDDEAVSAERERFRFRQNSACCLPCVTLQSSTIVMLSGGRVATGVVSGKRRSNSPYTRVRDDDGISEFLLTKPGCRARDLTRKNYIAAGVE